MPRYVASGIHERKNPYKSKGKAGSDSVKYRFLVMQRFGDDLQKKLQSVNHTFDLKTTYTIAKKVIDILEYIHSFGYIHADIKASNLLLGRSYAPTPKGKGVAEANGIHSEVWLVDFGLVEKFRNQEGLHRGEEEDQRRANNGTVEFTSRDAHIGALSRRSDLEILGFNMLSWLSGSRLPWMFNLKDHKYVHHCKKLYMDNLHELFNYAFGKEGQFKPPPDVQEVHDKLRTRDPDEDDEGKKKRPKVIFDKKKLNVKVPAGLVEYFKYVAQLDFTEDPGYDLLKQILTDAIGHKEDDGRFCFGKVPAKTVAKITSKLKRSSLSSPEAGRRKNIVETIEDAESNDERPVNVRARKASVASKAVPKKKVAVIPPKKEARVGRGKTIVRSSSTSPLKSPTRSAPTSSMTPNKTNPASTPSRSPFEKPTPAMLEIMRKLKEKHLKKTGVPSKLFAEHSSESEPCTSTAVKGKGKKFNPESNGSSTPSSAEKRKLGRPRKHAAPSPPLFKNGHTSESTEEPSPPKKSKGRKKIVSEESSDDEAEILEETPKKRGKAKLTRSDSLISNGKKVSSNSSTHSTKENKGRQGSNARPQVNHRYPRRNS